MRVPRSDTETRSAAFDHLIIACFLPLVPPLLVDDLTFLFFLLQNATLCFIIHCRLFLQGFISDIMPPLCPLAARAEQAASFRCRYHAYIVYSLDSHFTLCCLSSLHVASLFLFVCLWHEEWMLSQTEGWVMWSTKSTLSPSHAAHLCRAQRCLIKFNASAGGWTPSQKACSQEAAGSLDGFLLSVAIKSLMSRFNLKKKKKKKQISKGWMAIIQSMGASRYVTFHKNTDVEL